MRRHMLGDAANAATPAAERNIPWNVCCALSYGRHRPSQEKRTGTALNAPLPARRILNGLGERRPGRNQFCFLPATSTLMKSTFQTLSF
jgi:hypothetical protein